MRTTNPTQLAGASPRYLTDRSIKRRTTTEALPLGRPPYKYGNKAEKLGSHAAESDRLSPVCEVFARSPSTNTDNIVLRAGTSTFGASGMITQMRRRDFVTFLSGATAWVAAARAQESQVIGVLSSASYGAYPAEASFIQGLKSAGFLEGKNISIEWRLAEGQYNRLPSLVNELVGRGVAVIVTLDVPSSFAAKAATRTIPIVFAIGADPVKLGLVESFNQPSGNLTGVTTFLSSLGPKQLELLHELLPGSSRVAFLVNPSNLNSQIDAPEIQAAADSLGQHLEVLTASTENELDTAFTTMVRERIEALLVKPDPFFIDRCKRLVALASHHAVPAIYSLPVFVEVGGLMSYGADLAHAYQHAGIYVGKILRGAKPADLPIQQSIKFELVINVTTAKTLGLTVPPSLLARADAVIE